MNFDTRPESLWPTRAELQTTSKELLAMIRTDWSGADASGWSHAEQEIESDSQMANRALEPAGKGIAQGGGTRLLIVIQNKISNRDES
ncbi:MAG: hypothetical protein RQ826_09380 [Xanthomonadales bacterium]|nr:hypothetical protein [Xanthomonadales bacterium]